MPSDKHSPTIFRRLFRRLENQALSRLDKYPIAVPHLPDWQAFIERARPYELYRINPLYLGEKLGWRPNLTLDMLTYAVAEGLWRLHWEARCPACGGLLQQGEHLGELHGKQVCKHCGWEGEIALDQEVTVDASISPQVRSLPATQRENPSFKQAIAKRLGHLPALALINRPLFREMLGVQTLPPDQSLGVERLVIFFSDLKSSTAMYERLGDERAYQLVRKHFDVIFRAVEAEGGAAVKTIGDGVMGTFFDPQAALRGITAVLRGLDDINRQENLRGEDRLRLKVGIHTGACIVVTLNHRLDYFGTTVNIAARLSDLSAGEEIILSQRVLANDEIRQWAHSVGELQVMETALRGVSQPIEAYRMRLR